MWLVYSPECDRSQQASATVPHSARFWPNQDSGTWEVILWQQTSLKTSLRARHCALLKVRDWWMNEPKGRTKDRSRSKCVGYSVPTLLYSFLFYYVHPVYGSLCFRTKSCGLSTRCVHFLWQQYGVILSLYSKHRCMYSRSTLFSVRYKRNTYSIMWVDICLGKAGVRS